jgi:hypothetical protein
MTEEFVRVAPWLLTTGASVSERWQALGVGPQRKLENG